MHAVLLLLLLLLQLSNFPPRPLEKAHSPLLCHILPYLPRRKRRITTKTLMFVWEGRGEMRMKSVIWRTCFTSTDADEEVVVPAQHTSPAGLDPPSPSFSFPPSPSPLPDCISLLPSFPSTSPFSHPSLPSVPFLPSSLPPFPPSSLPAWPHHSLVA